MRLRYCTTWHPPACSIESGGNSSSRATRESGTARRSKEPASKQQQPLLFDPRLSLLFRRGARLLAGFGQHAGALADAEHVQDQGDTAVAHDGCAGVTVEPFQLLAQRLDHDFLGVVDAVYDQAELPVFGLKDDHAAASARSADFRPST